nr:uncharacterized protein LOC114295433 [Ipomoea batatas]
MLEAFSIPINRQTRCSDTVHDQSNPVLVKPGFLQGGLNEKPRKSVICLFKIQLNSHVARLTLLSTHGMHDLLIYDNIIGDLSTWYERALERSYQLWKNALQPVRDCFGNQLIAYIAQANRSSSPDRSAASSSSERDAIKNGAAPAPLPTTESRYGLGKASAIGAGGSIPAPLTGTAS